MWTDYTPGSDQTGSFEAAIYGLGADRTGRYLIVSDSFYTTLSYSFYLIYTKLAESVDLYYSELMDITNVSVVSGEFHDSLVLFASLFESLSGKLSEIGDTYKSLCSQFISEVEFADEDMYEAGCDPRDYSDDRMEYFITLIRDTKGHCGSWLDNLINNIWERLKNAFFSLTQKNKSGLSAPNAKYLKEYRQALMDRLNYDEIDIKNIQKEELLIDTTFSQKFGALYDSLMEIRGVIVDADSIICNGFSRSDISSLLSRASQIVVYDNKEIAKEEITVENAEQYCSNESNREVFISYSDELDKARKGIGVEEAIYSSISLGLTEAKLESFGGSIPPQVAPSERYSYLLLKKQLAETVGKMAGNPTDISEYEKERIYQMIYKALSGDDSEIPPQYKEFFKRLINLLKKKSKVVDFVMEDVAEALLPLMYDYSENIKIIKSLSNGSQKDSLLGIAVQDLLQDYSDKVSASFKKILDLVEEKIASGVAGRVTGFLKDAVNTYIPNANLYAFMAEQVAELSGINDIGNASMELYALYDSNEQLMKSYRANFDIVASGNYTALDVENLKNSFDILKQTFKEEFKLAAEIAGNEGKQELKRHYKELYKKIDSMDMSDFL